MLPPPPTSLLSHMCSDDKKLYDSSAGTGGRKQSKLLKILTSIGTCGDQWLTIINNLRHSEIHSEEIIFIWRKIQRESLSELSDFS